MVRGVDSVFYHSLSGSYYWEDQGVRVLFGVANLTDEEPPQMSRVFTGGRYSMVGNSAFYSQYDWLGRRAFMNVTWDFD